jgi:hypothetical protein
MIQRLKVLFAQAQADAFLRAVCVVFLTAFAARLAVFLYILVFSGGQGIFTGDSLRYLSLADSTLSGNGYQYEGVAESFRAPGYPAFFMISRILGLPLWVASLLQLTVSALLPAWATWFAVRKLALSLRTGLIVGLLVAIEPVQVYYGVILLPDVLFSIGAIAAFTYVIRSLETGFVRYAAYAGIAIGLANYVRPAMLYLPFFLMALYVGYALWQRASVRKAILHGSVITAMAFAVMSPWYVRNYVTFGHAAFVSAKDYTMYAYVAAATKAAAEGRTYEAVKQDLLAQANAEAPSGDRETFANSDYYSTRAREVLLKHPEAFVKVYTVGLLAFWTSGNYQYLFKSMGLLERPSESVSYSMILASNGFAAALGELASRITEPFILVSIFDRLLWLSIFALSCVGVLLYMYRKEYVGWLTALFFVYFSATILSTVVGVEARHRYALIPIMIALAAAASVAMYRSVRGRFSASRTTDSYT